MPAARGPAGAALAAAAHHMTVLLYLADHRLQQGSIIALQRCRPQAVSAVREWSKAAQTDRCSRESVAASAAGSLVAVL